MKKLIALSMLATLFYTASAPAALSTRAAQTPGTQSSKDQRQACTTPDGKPCDARSNGISVGRPKVFDNRTLTIMLENLKDTLNGMQASFINPPSLLAAFGNLQGAQSREVERNFRVTTNPVPSFKQEDIAKTGNVTDAGDALPDTTQQTTISERASFAPQVPELLGGAPTVPGFSPTYGANPSDLLSDQVNLTYQIFNLQMLLERSLSDRLLSGDELKPRRQAVLGFNISLDPLRTAEDAVAVVEITLNLKPSSAVGSEKNPLSLVAVMPQEKTYNSAALNTKSNAFGGAAVVSMFQVGYSERRRGQNFYLYRDNDTVSYERMDGANPDQITFGWMFRPVLGRRSVSPGMRQLFAIVSLPKDDLLSPQSLRDSKRRADPVQAVKLDASVKTYWKKYHRETMTSFDEHDTNRAGRFRNVMSLGLLKPELFGPRHINTTDYKDLEVRPTEEYQRGLRPELAEVRWRLVGQKNVVISARGNNFFNGTRVIMGDKTYSTPAEGLVLKSNQALELTTSLDSLATGAGTISGRYDTAIAMDGVVKAEAFDKGFTIKSNSLEPSLAGSHLLTVDLQSPDSNIPLDLPGRDQWGDPVVILNGKVVPPPYQVTEIEAGVHKLKCYVPDTLLGKEQGGLLIVSYPFLPEQWTTIGHISDRKADFEITRLSGRSVFIRTKHDLGFVKDLRTTKDMSSDKCWKVIVEDKPTPFATEGRNVIREKCGDQSPSAGTAEAKKPIVSGLKITLVSDNAVLLNSGSEIPEKIIVVDPYGATFSLEVPKLTPPAATPPKPVELNQHDSVWLNVDVDDASKVVSVETTQGRLEHHAPPQGDSGTPVKTIEVRITRDVTEKPGDVDLKVMGADGKLIKKIRVHISDTDDKGEKQ